MKTDFDAIVIGAGPAGSAAAILLACAGWSVALVEKQRFPRRKVCGECLAASNLPLLQNLGIAAAFDAAAGPELRQVAWMCGKGMVVSGLPGAADDQYRWGRAISRETLDAVLLEQARTAGAHILQPWSIKRIDGSMGDWRCDARDHTSNDTVNLRTPLLIDAHGSWEALNTSHPAPRVQHKGSDLLAFKANFLGVKLQPGLLPVLSFEGGYGGMVVSGKNLTTVAGCIRRDRFDALRNARPGLSAGDTFYAMLRRECAGVGQALRTAQREGPWLAAGPLHTGMHVRGDDQMFRIGNAAGEAHPIIGEGMSMALQSAWLLCQHLLAAGSRDEDSNIVWQQRVAERYAAQWRRQFLDRLHLASVFAHIAMRPALAAPLLKLAHAWPSVLTWGAVHAGKTRYVTDGLAQMAPLAPIDVLQNSI